MRQTWIRYQAYEYVNMRSSSGHRLYAVMSKFYRYCGEAFPCMYVLSRMLNSTKRIPSPCMRGYPIKSFPALNFQICLSGLP